MNKKEQLIEKIMQEIEYMIYDTKYNDIKQILQDTLPEDNEGDVVEIKEANSNNKFHKCLCGNSLCWSVDNYCYNCGKKIIRID